MKTLSWAQVAGPRPTAFSIPLLHCESRLATVAVDGQTTTQGQTWKVYYYAGSQRIAMRVLTSSSDTLYYLHADHLGSTSLTTDSNGNRVGELKYYPFGATRDEWGSTPIDRRYTGQVSEESTLGSLYFFNARYYSPAIGRFLSADTIVPEPGNPQQFNRYVYSLSNPLKYTDPTGHDVDCSPWDSACKTQVEIEKIIAGSNKHPVFVDPALFGFKAGVNVDYLPYLFYLDPRLFEFTASVQWNSLETQAEAELLLVPLVGQGFIPADIFNRDEDYPVIEFRQSNAKVVYQGKSDASMQDHNKSCDLRNRRLVATSNALSSVNSSGRLFAKAESD